MEIEIVQSTPRLVCIALTGRLDTPGVDRIETRFNVALGGGVDSVVDLSGVTFLASMGVRLLLTGAKLLNRKGARMVLVAPSGLVGQALTHSSLDELIPVARDTDAALALLAS